jgi:hypothetical protein
MWRRSRNAEFFLHNTPTKKPNPPSGFTEEAMRILMTVTQAMFANPKTSSSARGCFRGAQEYQLKNLRIADETIPRIAGALGK